MSRMLALCTHLILRIAAKDLMYIGESYSCEGNDLRIAFTTLLIQREKDDYHYHTHSTRNFRPELLIKVNPD